MNTLLLQKLFHNWPQVKNLLSFVENEEFGIKEIEGISGSVTAFFAKELSKKCVFVVPSEKDCSELILDLTTVFTDDKGILQADILTLPGFGIDHVVEFFIVDAELLCHEEGRIGAEREPERCLEEFGELITDGLRRRPEADRRLF